MSHYTHNIIFICSISLQEVAKRISRSLDPDVGGYEAFNTLSSVGGIEPATHAVYGTPVRESFVATVQELNDANIPLANRSAALKQMVDADYAARWPNDIAPTLAECEAFLSNLQTFIDGSFSEVLANTGLQIITP